MKVTIYQPQGFSEVGSRTNNEDNVYPAIGAATPNQQLFMVCDGVGGQHKGEVASTLTCEAMAAYFEKNPVAVADESYVKAALVHINDLFVQKEQDDPETQGMATTLTLLHFNEAGATMAHLGDSRIYQIRNGKILYVSEDHKLVNEWVREGRIAAEEAASHPQRNVITKVVSASRRDIPDVKITNDIEAGDYFFLCSDGVLERIYDDLLIYYLRNTDDNQLSDAEKLEGIRQECLSQTRDNFSAYLVRVESVAAAEVVRPVVASADPAATFFFEAQPLAQNTPPPLPKVSPKPTNYWPLVGLLAVAGVLIGGVLFWNKNQEQTANATPPIPIVEAPKNEYVEEATPAPKVVSTPPKRLLVGTTNKTRPVLKEILVSSQKYGFDIVKVGRTYYCWEPKKRRKTPIKEKDYDGIENVAHYYSFDSKNFYLLLEKPQKRIEKIDGDIKLGESTISYVQAGKKHTVRAATGEEVLPSVKDKLQALERAKAIKQNNEAKNAEIDTVQ